MESRQEKMKEDAKVEKLAMVHEHLLPRVIDLDMIMKYVYLQGPTGEAGRIAKDEGLELNEVTNLHLEYLRILKMDHFWVLPNLTKLKLNNNSIETIDNIHMLVHLRELDLSFNCIWVIENLEENVNLEVLNLYSNKISKLENMENLKKLSIFGIGENQIEDKDAAIMYLRQFRKLKSLSLIGNPMCETENFIKFVFAYLPNLVYYEYTMISADERAAARTLLASEVAALEEADERRREEIEREEREAEEAEQHSVSFVERLNDDQLFIAMFEKDPEGQLLATLSDETKELYDTYRDDFTAVCRELFEMGQAQYQLRRKELDDFLTCVNDAKGQSQQLSQKTVKDFIDTFKAIKEDVFKALKYLDDDDTEDPRMDKLPSVAEAYRRNSDAFVALVMETWQTLMKAENTLFEQMEDVNTTLERDMSDMVNVMLERALGYFVELRSLQETYNEQISEICQRHLIGDAGRGEGEYEGEETEGNDKSLSFSSSSSSVKGSVDLLREILSDKETLNNALANSHDIHMSTIDAREDTLATRLKAWHEEVCESLQRKTIAQNRATVIEINQFLDLYREMFEDLLADRPDDLSIYMEEQTEGAIQRASDTTIKLPTEEVEPNSQSHPSITLTSSVQFSSLGVPTIQTSANDIVQNEGAAIEEMGAAGVEGKETTATKKDSLMVPVGKMESILAAQGKASSRNSLGKTSMENTEGVLPRDAPENYRNGFAQEESAGGDASK